MSGLKQPRGDGERYVTPARAAAKETIYRVVENVVDSIESTRIVSPVVDSSYRKSICMYRYFTDLDFPWSIQGG